MPKTSNDANQHSFEGTNKAKLIYATRETDPLSSLTPTKAQ